MEYSNFPQYADGNVKLTIHPDVYHLHSGALAAYSSVLGGLVGTLNTPDPLPHLQGMDHLGVYNLELVGHAAHRYGVFQIQVPRQVRSEAPGFQAFEYTRVWPARTRRCWENIFKMFYTLPPNLHDDDPAKNILDNSWRVVELAVDIDAAEFIFPALGAELERYGQELYRCISNDPIGWANFGLKIQSVTIFQEAIVHTVGRWNFMTDQGYTSLSDRIREICKRKHQDLEYHKKLTDVEILDTPVDETQDRDVYMWMARAIYRKWLCQCIADYKTYRSQDGGAAFYRAINTGGHAYLNVVDPDTQLVLLPIAQDEIETMEARLNLLKNAVKPLVADLLVNRSRFDPGAWGELPYLTCCEVTRHDIPWLADRPAQEDVALIQTMSNNLPAMNDADRQGGNSGTKSPQNNLQIAIGDPVPVLGSWSPTSPPGAEEYRTSNPGQRERTPMVHEPDMDPIIHEPELTDDSLTSFVSSGLWENEADTTAQTDVDLAALPAFADFAAEIPCSLWDDNDNGVFRHASPVFMASAVGVEGDTDEIQHHD
ncbi:hypothetical protein AbraIFM66951_001227 [Aspergillus brasiliensis]|uniref:Uncharacterized protein n=1 Tax=Aspergillus brasiliensis TaxID=319629 RepID=A0A9W5YU13_9EURO|nr:hypothetical protein AbraCBS73388_009334 [Aspergillus brasiliensis]GKZ48979.1 hypothetical protein AbraIFM66951_001227 [Aspergillus brasiliensis]